MPKDMEGEVKNLEHRVKELHNLVWGLIEYFRLDRHYRESNIMFVEKKKDEG